MLNEPFVKLLLRAFTVVLPHLATAFEVDRLLKRTFLRAIPVWELHTIAATRMFDVADLCIAMVSFFPPAYLAADEVGVFFFTLASV